MPFNEFVEVKARKRHTCVHCRTPIVIGERHRKYVGTWHGDFQSWRVHADCFDSMQDCNDLDDGLCNEVHVRGKSCHDRIVRVKPDVVSSVQAVPKAQEVTRVSPDTVWVTNRIVQICLGFVMLGLGVVIGLSIR
jgi:hypothetical protein